MIKIIILKSLRDEIFKTFKRDSLKIYSLIESLKENPHKGKILGHVGVISIRELKYKSYRFYFVINSQELYLFSCERLEELLIRFIKMSKKHNQEKTIREIKEILEKL